MKIAAFGASDTGKKRENNEDAYLVDDALGLYAVADGIGGNAGGEVASRIAVATLASVLTDMLAELPDGSSSGDEKAFSVLRAAADRANRNIREERFRRPELTGMGTTLSAILLREGRAYLLHIGDSRVYLFRAGELSLLSVDHSLVAEYVQAGLLTPQQARVSPYRHVITRALGIEDAEVPDTKAESIRQGDILLLCTDGLTEMVSDEELANILASHAPREAVRKLIDAANGNGGVDNITAVVVEAG